MPKDLRALTAAASAMGIETPVLESISVSNEVHVGNGVALVVGTGCKRVGLLGLSFKAGTDDLRESPLVQLAERLLAKGLDVKIFDRSVNLARLVGANKAFIDKQLPHLSGLLVDDMDEVLAHAECVVIGNPDKEFRSVAAKLRPDQVMVDLVRVSPGLRSGGNYEGICW